MIHSHDAVLRSPCAVLDLHGSPVMLRRRNCYYTCTRMEKTTDDGDPARRRPGRPAVLSRDQVLEAALLLFDAHGVDAVTIRRVAAELGVSPMALYRHVADKDELLLALVDRLAARLHYPNRPQDPREAILTLWATLYGGLAEHPWLPEVLARRRLMAFSVLDAIEEIHANLVALGLSLDQAVVSYRVMWQFTLGVLLVRAEITSRGTTVQQQLRGAPDPGRHPNLAATAEHWNAAQSRDTYLTDLATLLDGLLRTGPGDTEEGHHP